MSDAFPPGGSFHCTPPSSRRAVAGGGDFVLAPGGFERESCILAVQRVAGQLASTGGHDAIRLVKVMLGPIVRLTFEQGRLGRTTVEMPPDWYAMHNPDDVIRKRLGELIERERAKKATPIGRRGHW